MSIKNPEDGIGIYEITTIPIEYGTSLVEINVTDITGNENIYRHTVFIDYVKDFKFENIHIQQAKKGLIISRRFFTAPVPLDIKLQLNNFSYYPDDTYLNVTDQNYTIYIDYDGKRSAPVKLNQPFKLIEVKNLSVSIVGGVVGNFEGSISMTLPSSTGETSVKVITFTGRIADFRVPEKFDGKIRGIPVECLANVKESAEESSYLCTYYYPIDVSPADFDVIGTPRLLEIEREAQQNNINEYRRVTNNAVARFNGSVIISLIVSFMFFWNWKIRGRFMWSF